MKKTINKILKFRDDRNWKQFHTPENLAKSISIESAELLENFQWGKDFDRDNVLDELADVMNYCILMADALDADVIEIINNKINKNDEKYPISKSLGVSTKYNKF